MIPAGVLVLVPLFAAVYAYITVYSPIVGLVSFVLVTGAAVGLGTLLLALARWGHCRNPGALVVAGVLTGLFALYCSWVWFEFALLQKSDAGDDVSLVGLFLSPRAVWGIAGAIAEDGWYRIRGVAIAGPLLWFLWSLEALAFVVVPGWFASDMLRKEVYCETCERWCEVVEGGGALLALHADGSGPEQAAASVESLLRLPLASAEVRDRLRPELKRCSDCGETCAWRVERWKTEVDGSGKIATAKSAVGPWRSCSAQDFARLLQRTQPAAPASGSEPGAGDARAQPQAPAPVTREEASAASASNPELAAQIRALSAGELRQVLSLDRERYTDEALALAEEEHRRRGFRVLTPAEFATELPAEWKERVGYCWACWESTTSETAGVLQAAGNIGSRFGRPRNPCPKCLSTERTRWWKVFSVPLVPGASFRVLETEAGLVRVRRCAPVRPSAASR